jgi:hypothetical protein
MRYFLFVFLSIALLGAGCKKSHECGCAPPPRVETSWKITKRTGGIGGGEIPLTSDQQNSILTIKPDGHYSCINIVSRMIVEGTYASVNYNSIYGDRPRMIFTPKLPMLQDEYMILLDNQSGEMKFGNNIADGYYTYFTAQ